MYSQCGSDITGCEEATMCSENEEKCVITYCDSKIEGNICTEEIKTQTTEGIQVENQKNINTN